MSDAPQPLRVRHLGVQPYEPIWQSMSAFTNSRDDNTMDELQDVIAKVDVITINDEEARQLSGEYNLVQAAKAIQGMGPQTLIIKKGEHGALLFSADEVFYAPALPLEEVFDPTGAGDTFAGGLMGYLSIQEEVTFDSLKKAVIAGSALASFCVEKFGTQRLEELTKNELDERIKEFYTLSQFELA